MEKLTDAFQEMFSHKIDISMEDISALYEKVKKSRKTYKLVIQIKDKEGNSFKKLKTCDISLVDNYGSQYPLTMEPLMKSLYLTFILFKEGKESLLMNTRQNLSKIRKCISNANNDVYAKEQFAVDGYSGHVYKVAGATDEDRELIKKEFGIE